MSNPPVNRRPGVDAGIIQGQWVRGFDVPAGDQGVPPPSPGDLLISNGKSQIDQAVSNLIFASRTDAPTQPIFVLAQGSDPTMPIGSLGFHIGSAADPNGTISGAGPGALYASYGTPSLWQLQADDATWIQISDDLGGENLAETLAIGNTTGGHNIRITSGDGILGVDDATGVGGANVLVTGGAGTAPVGAGGTIFITGGASVGGATGSVRLASPLATNTATTGAVSLATGASLLGGNSGGISMLTGDTGAAGLGGTAGSVVFTGGNSLSTGVFGQAGSVTFNAGFSQTSGQGGRVLLFAGNATGAATPQFLINTAGQGGEVRIGAGNSSGTRPGGAVQITAGTGGSGGAVGGNILLTPGSGGGGFNAGIVNVAGVLQSSNIKRGSGNPNGSVAGDEGDVFQRTDSGVGEIYLNTNGSINGWQRLAFAGEFVESFEQLNWGYFSRSGNNNGGLEIDNYAAQGIFKGLAPDDTGAGSVEVGGNLDGGPVVSFEAPNNNDIAAVSFPGGGDPRPHATEQEFILTIRARNVFSSNNRIFIGLSDLDAATQLSATAPAGANYLGFLLDPAFGTWRVVSNNTLGATILDTGVSGVSTSTLTDGWFFVIDATDSSIGIIRFFILDPSLTLQSSISAVASLPTLGTVLGTLMGIRKTAADAQNKRLEVISASIVNDAASVGQGGGSSLGNLSLNQVLINGNETGNNPILINQGGGGLLGVTDDDAGDGASFGIFGGATTLAGNDTGSVTVGSGNAFGGGAQNAGASTGVLLLGSGNQLAVASLGNTGTATLLSGDHVGSSGTTGDVVLRTGGFTNAGAGVRTQGNILIAPGSLAPNTATVTGDVTIKGGSSNVVGTTGGDVSILSGENSAATGDTGDILVSSFDVNLVGASGSVSILTGAGGSNSGDSGNIELRTGDGIGAGGSGDILLSSGNAANGGAGLVSLSAGSSTSGPGATITITAGDTSDGAQPGGRIVLNPGTGGSGDGLVQINGKLTVTGLIDPTGLLLDGQAVIPSPVAAGEGLIWIDNTGAPSRLIYTDDLGNNHDISTGGGVTTLGALSDVSLAGLAAGQVLTYNGAFWVNLPGVGGSPLSTILAIGNTTGGTPLVISDTLGGRITSDGDLEIAPAAAPGNAVVIDGLRWPETDGLAGYVLTTNGLGQLSFQAGGGGGGSGSFAEVFAQMQWGTLQPPPDVAVASELNGSGILHEHNDSAPGGGTTLQRTQGLARRMSGIGPNVAEGGFATTAAVTRPDNLGLYVWKFEISSTANVRLFLGITSGTRSDMVGGGGSGDAPVSPTNGYVGLGYSTSAADAGFVFWHSNVAGVGTRVATGIVADTAVHYFVVDASTAGQFTLTLYDEDFAPQAQSVIVASIPSATTVMRVMGALMPTGGIGEALFLYSCTAVHRADLLGAIGGGGGNQDLFSVLGFGNQTGGVAIQGSDNGAGAGLALDLVGGSSTGGMGAGGAVNILSGSADPAGNASGGNLQLTTVPGAGSGRAGDLLVVTGSGGPAGGRAGDFTVTAGNGVLAGRGGNVALTAGNGGPTAGFAGTVSVRAGNATGGNTAGARIEMFSGDGFGSGTGGTFNFVAGDGGITGNGGGFVFTVGSGNGGGSDGEIVLNGDTTITGKLTVTGLIDPTGLLMTSSGAVPFTAAGSEGGIWVNNAGELIYTNTGGDLNLSTAIGGGMGFLDALLTAGYGFMGPGNPTAGAQAYGIYGSSVVTAVSPGPPPASITFGTDTDGPFLNLAVGAAPLSEAFLGAADLFVRRGQQFRARFKFQVTSPAHTDERLFIGFTTDSTLTTPSIQLGSDDPAALQYLGIRQDLAATTLQFVSRGSGGAIAPVLAIPTDALVHYLEIDASDASGDVTMTVLASDGVTVQATHTEAASFLLPNLTTSLRPFLGIHTGTGTTPRGIDFYAASIVTRADVIDAVVSGGGSGGTPALSAVLGAGNTTGGTSILVDSSIAGDGVSLLLNGGSGGAGGTSQISVAISAGDNGGAVQAVAGSGAGAAGAGGAVQLVAGDGAGTGNGGSLQFNAGGAAAGGGNGGSVQFVAGDAAGGNGTGGSVDVAAGDSFGNTDGGALNLIAGDGGLGAGTGDGGFINLIAGSPGGSGAEGGILALAGNAVAVATGNGAFQAVGSSEAADVLSSASFLVGAATGSLGGSLRLEAGRGSSGTGADGGNITITTLLGDGAGDPGRVAILGAGAVPTAVSAGGDIQLAARVFAGGAAGGTLLLDAGSAVLGGIGILSGGHALVGSGVLGGPALVSGGNGDGVGPGGFAQIRGGNGGSTGNGGDVQVRGGVATGGANTGGDVRLIPGTGPSGDGVVSVEGRLNPSAAGLQYGATALPVGGALAGFAVAFNTPFATVPTTVRVSLEAAAGQSVTVTPASITTAGFSINTAIAVAVGTVLHWDAYL